MLEMMEKHLASPSPWTSFDQISSSGWEDYFGAFDDPFPQGLQSLLAEKNWKQEDFQKFKNTYPQPWIGPNFLPGYIVWANPIAGVIIVTFAVSPLKPYVEQGSNKPQPLCRLSDYAFLAYQQACRNAGQNEGQCLRRLEWIIRHSVANQLSIDVAKLATSRAQGYRLWPGETFGTDRIWGKMLLGCKNGYGVAYLLADHVSQLGLKTVDTVTVFGDNIGGVSSGINFAYHIKYL